MGISDKIDELKVVTDDARVVTERERAVKKHADGWEKGIQFDGTDGFVNSGLVDAAPADGDWSQIMEEFGLDPSVYMIHPDSVVQVRAWDANMGKDADGNHLGIQRMRYYRAPVCLRNRFTFISEEELREIGGKFKPPSKKVLTADYSSPHAFVVNLADWQLGKGGEGNDVSGVEATVERINASIGGAKLRLAELRKTGINVETLVIAGLGDLIERCFAGDTLVVTDKGLRPIRELAAEGSAVVRTSYGKWVEAPVKSFGSQEIWEVTVGRGSHVETIRTTEGHRWLVQDVQGVNRPDRLTEDLRYRKDDVGPQDYLPVVFGGKSAHKKRRWKVLDVRATGEYEEVFCPQVPDTECFVLGGTNILTGNCSQNYASQAYSTELNERQQFRLGVRLFVKVVKELAPLAPKVIVFSVGGNHGETRNAGKMFTDTGDNFDTAMVDMASMALEAYENVKFVPLENKLWVTLDLYGVAVGWTHGHLARGGATASAKQYKWWQQQAVNKTDIGDVEVLVTGHYHSFNVTEHSQGALHLQCPAMDSGSEWWQNATGERSTPGTLTFVVGPSTRLAADKIQVV